MTLKTLSPQALRILDALLAADGPIDMPTLSRLGSGKSTGFCGSFTRRVSDLREALAASGKTVIRTEEFRDGFRHTFYQIAPIGLGKLIETSQQHFERK